VMPPPLTCRAVSVRPSPRVLPLAVAAAADATIVPCGPRIGGASRRCVGAGRVVRHVGCVGSTKVVGHRSGPSEAVPAGSAGRSPRAPWPSWASNEDSVARCVGFGEARQPAAAQRSGERPCRRGVDEVGARQAHEVGAVAPGHRVDGCPRAGTDDPPRGHARRPEAVAGRQRHRRLGRCDGGTDGAGAEAGEADDVDAIQREMRRPCPAEESMPASLLSHDACPALAFPGPRAALHYVSKQVKPSAAAAVLSS
jgi:hypothetical protein